MTPQDPDNNNNPPKDPEDKKRSINDITNELLEQLKDGPNDYFMGTNFKNFKFSN